MHVHCFKLTCIYIFFKVVTELSHNCVPPTGVSKCELIAPVLNQEHKNKSNTSLSWNKCSITLSSFQIDSQEASLFQKL